MCLIFGCSKGKGLKAGFGAATEGQEQEKVTALFYRAVQGPRFFIQAVILLFTEAPIPHQYPSQWEGGKRKASNYPLGSDVAVAHVTSTHILLVKTKSHEYIKLRGSLETIVSSRTSMYSIH